MGKPHYGEFKFGKSPARPTSKGYAKGGEAKGQAKVAKVMTEFKAGDLHSGSKKGPVVKNPKQAMAIALSEKKAAGYKEGGRPGLWDNIHAKRERIKEGSGERMRKPGSKGAPTAQDFKDASTKMKKGGEPKKEPKQIVKKEIALLKKADAPAKIIKHEERELQGYKSGGAVKKYEEGGSVTPKSMMKDKARAKEVMPPQVQRQPGASVTESERARMRPQPTQATGASMTERERRMLEAAREEKMDRQMREAEKERGVHSRMLDEAMNPLSIMREMYDRATDRSGQSATENMKRYGMKEGGSAKHEDLAMDKKMIKKAVHKHETAMHPGEPLTKMQVGGSPAEQQRMQMNRRPSSMPMTQDQYRISQLEAMRDMDRGNLFRRGNVRSYNPAILPVPSPQTNKKPIVNTSGLGFEKGGSAKKGVPVHKRNAKIC